MDERTTLRILIIVANWFIVFIALFTLFTFRQVMVNRNDIQHLQRSMELTDAALDGVTNNIIQRQVQDQTNVHD